MNEKELISFKQDFKLCGLNIVYFNSTIDIMNTILLSQNKKMKKIESKMYTFNESI